MLKVLVPWVTVLRGDGSLQVEFSEDPQVTGVSGSKSHAPEKKCEILISFFLVHEVSRFRHHILTTAIRGSDYLISDLMQWGSLILDSKLYNVKKKFKTSQSSQVFW